MSNKTDKCPVCGTKGHVVNGDESTSYFVADKPTPDTDLVETLPLISIEEARKIATLCEKAFVERAVNRISYERLLDDAVYDSIATGMVIRLLRREFDNG